KTLHWSLGDQLYTRPLTELFKFAPGAPDSLVDKPASHQSIGFRYALDKPTGVIALTGAKLITMRGDEIIDDGVIVVTGSRITAAGPWPSMEIPKAAK